MIVLPLPPILASLPPNLASLAASPGAGTFSLPVKTVLAQLASGAVKILFGELRQGSPPGTFYDNATQDRALVSLPLPQILASLDPALLGRRPGQKTVAVPESVTSIFGLGRNLQATLTPAPAPVHEAAPRFAPKPPSAQPGASPFTRLPKPAPLSSLAAKVSAPAVPFLPSAVSKPPAMPSPASHAEEKEVLPVALSLLSESWPSPVLQAIAELQLENDIAAMPMIVALPMNRLERGLKTGRVVIPWGELSQWLQPPLPARSLANPGVALELPLKVVAPLFMARRRPGPVPQKLTSAANIPGHIPNIFDRTPAAPESAVSPPVTAPSASPAVSPLGEIFGLPGRIEWTPQEICRRICALEGVAGSALAMNDGLVVAAHLPPLLNPETVAAFLPQIFARVSRSAAEMQLGPLTGIVLTVGQARCAIYKTGRLYLAVLGRPGAALPEAILGRIAAELAKRNP
jgi:predicted regulator of Ras-like GTPase activity (Roadblock/LC7/MglB family)